MDLDQIGAFLILAEELHFGRTAERLYVSQPRVSRLVASLETEIGGALFDRTSRRVRLTPLGTELQNRLRPVHWQLRDAFEAARSSARGMTGKLRVGVTVATDVPALTHLVAAFERKHAECEVSVERVHDFWDPYAALRSGEIDVLCNWMAVNEPDLVRVP